MKTSALLATAVCVIAATTTTPVAAEKCVLTNMVKELEPITKMVYACYDATGYAVIPPRANPTAEQSAAVCAKCPEMIATAKTMTFASCTFAVSGVDIPLNEWMPKIISACAASASGSTSVAAAVTNGTASGNSTTAGAAATTNGTTAGSSGATKNGTSATTAAPTGASANGTAAKTNGSASASTPTPAPTTGSGASAMASLSVAAVAVGSLAVSLLM